MVTHSSSDGGFGGKGDHLSKIQHFSKNVSLNVILSVLIFLEYVFSVFHSIVKQYIHIHEKYRKVNCSKISYYIILLNTVIYYSNS